ncbi:flagellar hook-basal body complex protein [Pseudoalteromonas marina]|uniref:Flagellar basal-body rod protein FlgF n=1 Tax=Pseudoalteromonas marina TaxID=267375 RepID=A0ABT9FC50_9GAMM|nr:flagellar hook-basal body complex protein [Pseudoalteromonas marina]MDP2564352.1 flagellar hook-basal body complex protein [Pseudoalteromonas marina]
MIYTSMVAAKEIELRQSVVANNIANVSTPGFKQAVVATHAQDLLGAPNSTRSYAMTRIAGIDSSEGPIKSTGNPNDLTVRGDSWFTLQGSGGEYLSKNLSLNVLESGLLVTSNGDAIKGQDGNIYIPENVDLNVSETGEIFLKFPEQELMASAGNLKVVTAKSSDLQINQRSQPYSNVAAPAIAPVVLAGALQQSNVNQVSTAMESVNLSKQFQMNMKIFESAQTIADSTNRLIGN